jgi:hypothetical protein
LETSNKIYSIADFSINHKLSILLNKLKVLLQSEVPQEGQESVQTAINKIKEKKCKNIPTTFDISNPTYPIQTNTLQDAFLKFIFADPTSGANTFRISIGFKRSNNLCLCSDNSNRKGDAYLDKCRNFMSCDSE